MPQALILLLLLSLSAFAQTSAKVVDITDGDTITVISDRKQFKVRLAGIDAPEKGQDYSDSAKKYLSKLLFNQTIKLEGSKRDRNGRLIAKVFIDTRDVGLMMIQNGLAWHFTKYANDQSPSDRVLYNNAEASSRRNSLNLWRYPNPVAPWDYRAGGSANTPRPTPRQTETARTGAIASYPNGQIIGNKSSMIYHLPSCPSYDKVSQRNRVYFRTAQEAERAGYRVARNC